jgi:hypothetical protein
MGTDLFTLRCLRGGSNPIASLNPIPFSKEEVRIEDGISMTPLLIFEVEEDMALRGGLTEELEITIGGLLDLLLMVFGV